MSLLNSWFALKFAWGSKWYSAKEWDIISKRINLSMHLSLKEIVDKAVPYVLQLQNNASVGEYLNRAEVYQHLATLGNEDRAESESMIDFVANSFQAYKSVLDKLMAVDHAPTLRKVSDVIFESAARFGVNPYVCPETCSWSDVVAVAQHYKVSAEELEQVSALFEGESCSFVVWYMLGVALENSPDVLDTTVDSYYRAMVGYLYRKGSTNLDRVKVALLD